MEPRRYIKDHIKSFNLSFFLYDIHKHCILSLINIKNSEFFLSLTFVCLGTIYQVELNSLW